MSYYLHSQKSILIIICHYLGVIIDQHIRWSEHITNVSKRLPTLMHTFYNLRDILPRRKLLMFYNSLVEAVIRYCIVAWGGTFNTTLNILQTTQNTILKIIFNKSKLYSTEKLYN